MNKQDDDLTRRKFVSSAAALAAAMAAAPALHAQERPVQRSADHHFPNEQQPLKRNMPIEGESPSSVWAPELKPTLQPGQRIGGRRARFEPKRQKPEAQHQPACVLTRSQQGSLRETQAMPARHALFLQMGDPRNSFNAKASLVFPIGHKKS